MDSRSLGVAACLKLCRTVIHTRNVALLCMLTGRRFIIFAFYPSRAALFFG
jgi:hypothetical protein